MGESFSRPKLKKNQNTNSRKKLKGKKKKVQLLSSSQGRNCSVLLQQNLGEDFEVCGVVEPNAKLCDVVGDVQGLVKSFDENDCVIVLGGTNDVELDGKYRETVAEGIKNVLPLSKQTNVIINSIPSRFDRFDLQPHIRAANEIIHREVNKSKDKNSSNVRINFGNERLTRDCYTRHGLHLNLRGKSEMCKRLSHLVLDCVVKTTYLESREVVDRLNT